MSATIQDVLGGGARWCVVHGDNRDVLPTLPVVDAMVTDPPYGIGAEGGVGKYGRLRFEASAGDWDSAPDMELPLSRARRHVVFGGNYFALPPSRCWLVWDKGGGFKGRDFAEAELAWCSFDGLVRTLLWDPLAKGDYRDGNKVHPTQKPLAVMMWALGFASLAQNDVVLDPFAGSGTTGVAALRLGRRCILIEKDAGFAAIASERMEAASAGVSLVDARAGQRSLFGGEP